MTVNRLSVILSPVNEMNTTNEGETMTIATVTGFYKLEKANELADEMNSYEDDWTYKVFDCLNGYGRIDVIDECGEVVVSGFMA